MNTFVLDASALVKRVINEPDSPLVRAWFDRHANASFIGPYLLFAETGRTIQKKVAAQAQRETHTRLISGVHLIDVDLGVWDDVEGVTFSDAHYLHLARRLGFPLVTADKRLIAAAQRRKIPIVDIAQ